MRIHNPEKSGFSHTLPPLMLPPMNLMVEMEVPVHDLSFLNHTDLR